jgi:hypothetical protein
VTGQLINKRRQLCVLPLDQGAPPHHVNGAPLCRQHQPCAGVRRDAHTPPLFQSGDERVVGNILAMSRSRTSRATLPMSFADSMRQIVSIGRSM